MSFNKVEIEQIKELHPDVITDDGVVKLESPTAEKMLENYEEPKAFNKIGYARPLGGFFYEFFYGILGMILTVALFEFYLGILYPWPESNGYNSIAGVLFMFVQTIFNVPTNWAIDMFVGEWRVKNPRRMISFLSYYIWYQMLTGLFLITFFSWFILMVIGDPTKLEYVKWLMLLIIIREYPAFGGIFISTIRGLQAYNKEATYNFITGNITSKVIEVIFVLWGQYGIGANPVYGGIIGIAIGASIGGIVSDFTSEFIGVLYLKGVLNKLGFRLIDIFRPQFNWDVIKISMKFGIIVSIPGLFSAFFGTITTIWWYWGVPAYLTFTRLSSVADDFANLMKLGGGINIRGTLSEAYNSGMKNLTSYYLALQWKFFAMFAFALGSLVIAFMPFILTTLFNVAAQNYALAAAFVIPNIIATTAEQPVDSGDMMLLCAKRPEVSTALKIIANILGLVLMYLALFVFRVQDYGTLAIIWLIPMLPFLPNVFRMLSSWYYIGKKLCPLPWRKFFWQTAMAPLFPALGYGIIGYFWGLYMFPILTNAFGGGDLGMILSAVITVLFAIFFGLFFTFPMYSFFGGWDDNTLAIFRESVEIAGPSKFIFMPILKSTLLLVRHSPLHNKFPIPYEKAMEEAAQLMRVRHVKDKIITELKTLGKI
ncbi:MAG TPA: hypothetical protein VKM55_10365 [Candidatus Lokiarchaeia archaeon]|nr:hypothetical protein [Candidatus Lokiarchaeia archaeon]